MCHCAVVRVCYQTNAPMQYASSIKPLLVTSAHQQCGAIACADASLFIQSHVWWKTSVCLQVQNAITKQKKEEIVKEVKTRLQESVVVFGIRFKGLSVSTALQGMVHTLHCDAVAMHLGLNGRCIQHTMSSLYIIPRCLHGMRHGHRCKMYRNSEGVFQRRAVYMSAKTPL